MRLVVDAQALQTSGSRRGIGRYARSFLRALTRARPDWTVEAVLNTALPSVEDADALSRTSVARFTPPQPMRSSARSHNELYFGDWLSSRGADAILELSFFDEESLVPQFVRPRPPVAGLAFDLVPVLFHDQYLASPSAHAIYKRRFRQFAEADLFLAISETTRRDVLRLMDVPAHRAVTIGGAVEPVAGTSPLPPDQRARRLSALGIDGAFILYVGGTDPRKNLRGTLEAFAALPQAMRTSHRLVIVCELSARQEAALRAQAADLGIDSSLRLTNFVSDETLHLLYEACRASVFPSFYEGLGLPVLEALSRGAPVVASDRSSIPEFAGGAAILVDPSSRDAIARGLEQVLAVPREHQEELRRTLAARHTWDVVAARAVEALDSLAQGGGSVPVVRLGGSVPAGRPRVAWVSAVPPSDTPAARATSTLLPHLLDRFEVEVVVPPGVVIERRFMPGVPVLRPDDVWARSVALPFDLFVYHLDAAVEPFLEALMYWRSGLVVLHEGAGPVFGHPLLGGSEAIAVHDASAWPRVRHTASCPVFHLGMLDGVDDDLAGVARSYVAALQLTVAARRVRDGDWVDAASAALAEAWRTGSDDPGVFERWGRLRAMGRLHGRGEMTRDDRATEVR